ncbi:hypothetical protein CONCODRAFT_1935 [Conidiobolus coronatus NRRL 28638]|uniref:RING-type E3 ubiquitin transferase n=1 Tax=Conidiobolus coronatus (strain ATCC 28846 / CBS 209.66 / NRRL 28638) TaxID=796925 RepID=A0A137PIN5_CONC2|nr:hypothetical protein CONCODRAFT_1935 [Conidiobolus coronatus NRRL 28638]|eukprot:KXN74868.1 hypothetical protein CONCODRAFT_1935 [Conidiobolus coronatus NRRL 28638]
MGFLAYGAVSLSLSAIVLFHTFCTTTNYFAATIYLSNSNTSLMIMFNAGIYLTVMLGKLLQYIFFGPLRAIEVEHLYERSWFAVTETCLAMTIFKSSFDSQFIILFVTLLFIKTFHWLVQDRIELIEQADATPVSFHVKMLALIGLLGIVDTSFILYTFQYSLVNEVDMIIVFGFEYTILAINLIATFFKYIIYCIDSRSEESWESKSIYIFYLELVTDLFKLIVYVGFFMKVVSPLGIPLHMLRDIYITLKTFIQKCRDLVRYRQATRNMNERYPDATVEELQRMSDPTCIICREEMIHRDQLASPAQRITNAETPKKLPCNHIFHFNCLRSWLERQQSCPTCRTPVFNQPEPTPQPAPAPAVPAPQPANEPQPQPQHQQQPEPQPSQTVDNNVAGSSNNVGESSDTNNQVNNQPSTSDSTATATTTINPPPYSNSDSTNSVPLNSNINNLIQQHIQRGDRLPILSGVRDISGSPSSEVQRLIPISQLPENALNLNTTSNLAQLQLLPEQQLQQLDFESRDAIAERLRAVSEAQSQLHDISIKLAQALSSTDPRFVPETSHESQSNTESEVQSSIPTSPNNP